MSNIIQYGDFTQEDAQRAAEEKRANSGGQKTKFFKPEEGYTKIRIIPGPIGKPFRQVRHQHTVDVPGVGTVFFNCPQKAETRRPCVVCAKVSQLYSTKKQVDVDKAKNMSAKTRFMYNVLVRGRENEGVMVYEMGSKLDDELLEIRNVHDYDFLNPITGVDLLVQRTGKGKFDTRYSVSVADKGRGRPIVDNEDEIRMIIETQPDLSRFTRVPSDEEIQELLTTGKRSVRREEGGGNEPRLGRGRSIQDDMDDEE